MFGLKFCKPSELKNLGIMGMNARNHNVIFPNNPRCLYPLVDNKVLTKQLAEKFNINTPRLLGLIEYQYQVKKFHHLIKNRKEFVIKPAHGSGGKGVLVITDYTDEKFITISGRQLTYTEVYQHISNILSGLYSLGGKYDVAILEEVVHFTKSFKDFSYQGVPDVRIIVYKGYPAMAMTRLSTKASGGRANLHQGAVGVGLDICTGKTLRAVVRNKPIETHPDTGINLSYLNVPKWKEHLKIAAQAYEMTSLGYLGADIVLDEQKGPMLLELNARPGLAIQIANGCGLLEKIKKIDTYPQNLSAIERVEYILNNH